MISLRAMNCTFTRIFTYFPEIEYNITYTWSIVLHTQYKLFSENTKHNQLKTCGNIKVGNVKNYHHIASCLTYIFIQIYIPYPYLFHIGSKQGKTLFSWLSVISYQRIFFALSFLYVEFGKKMLMILYNLVYL